MEIGNAGQSGARSGKRIGLLGQASVILIAALILGAGVNALRPKGLPLGNVGAANPQSGNEAESTTTIALEDARTLEDQGRAVFVDARSTADFTAGHIRGAVNLPWQQVDERFMDVADRLESAAEIVTYCDGPSCRLSHDLAGFLKEMGFPRVRVLVNGWSLWRQAGFPVEGAP